MDTIAIRSSRGEGVVLGCKQIERSDIVAGNRYGERWGADGRSFIPDESGDWTALVTYRGPNAPARPTVLPVGTRVRRGAGWTSHGTGLPDTVAGLWTVVGQVVGHEDLAWIYQGACRWAVMTDQVEVVSLPDTAAPKPSEPKKPTGYDGDDNFDARRQDMGNMTCADVRGLVPEGQDLGAIWLPASVASLPRDYTPPAVLARRKPEPVKVRVDNGWDPHD